LKKKLSKALIIIGIILLILQILSIIGSRGLYAINFQAKIGRTLYGNWYMISLYLGYFLTGIIGTVLIVVGSIINDGFYLFNTKKAKKDFNKKTDVLCPVCKSLLPKGTSKCSVCGAKIND